MKQEKIQAYLLRVNKLSGVVYKGYLAEVDNTLEAEQRYVNYDEPHGLITVLSITDEIDVIANDEGKLKNYPINRFVVDDMGGVYDMLVGNLSDIEVSEDEYRRKLSAYKDMKSFGEEDSNQGDVISAIQNY